MLNLKKNRNLDGLDADVVLVLDYSGSMSYLYGNGEVQELVERVLPLGLAFDANKEVDFYLFHDGVIPLSEPLTLQNTAGYINDKILSKKWHMGSTSYAPVMKVILDKYTTSTTTTTTPSLLGGLFGKKPTTSTERKGTLNRPVYVLFITDGANDDKTETEKVLKEASGFGIFWQFIGIGRDKFPFLDKLDDLKGRVIDNANFFASPDLSKVSDNELYDLLLKEYPSWIQLAKAKNMF